MELHHCSLNIFKHTSLSDSFLSNTVHSLLCLTLSPLRVSPCPAPLIHSTRLGKGFPSEANSNVHLPSDPWPWADKVTSHDFYSRFCLYTSLCVAPAWNSKSDSVVMKSAELRGSGQTCCSDALQAQADKNIKTMTAKYERWTKPQRMLEREGSKRWRSTRIYTLNKSVI